MTLLCCCPPPPNCRDTLHSPSLLALPPTYTQRTNRPRHLSAARQQQPPCRNTTRRSQHGKKIQEGEEEEGIRRLESMTESWSEQVDNEGGESMENPSTRRRRQKKTDKLKEKLGRAAKSQEQNAIAAAAILSPLALRTHFPQNKKNHNDRSNPTQPNPTKEKKSGHPTCRTMPLCRPCTSKTSLLIQTPHHPTPLTTLLPKPQYTQPLPHTPPNPRPHRRKPTSTSVIRRRTLHKNPPLPRTPLRPRRRPTPKTIPPRTPPANSRTPPDPRRIRNPIHPRATPHQRPPGITPRPAAHMRRRIPIRRTRPAEETPPVPSPAEFALLALVLVVSVDLRHRWRRR